MTGAILAGGKATRFGGRNKAALQLGSAAIIERQLAILGKVVERTVIIADDEEPYRSYGVPVIPDVLPGRGAMGGVYTAVVSATTRHILVVAGDMPFLNAAFLRYLVERGDDVDIAIPTTARGYEPLCATYSRRCAPLLKRQIDSGRLKMTDVLTADSGLIVREVGPDEIERCGRADLMFFNINSADDYEQALGLFKQFQISDFKFQIP